MYRFGELVKNVNQMKRGRKYITNNFLSAAALKRISAQRDSELLYNAGAVALIYNDNGVDRLNFYLRSIDSVYMLAELLHKVQHPSLVTECVGTETEVCELTEALMKINFGELTRMSRWKCESINFSIMRTIEHDDTFQEAAQSDINKIECILKGAFDPRIAHLPSAEKLAELIRAGSVFCAKRKGRVIAVVCLEKLGSATIYVYQDAVDADFRSSGIGIMLLQFALYQFRDVKRYTSWTEDRNRASNRMHELLGFSRDGLKTAIMLSQ